MAPYSKLIEKQNKFAKNVALLIMYAQSRGYYVTFGDAAATRGHKQDSLHYIRLAIDLNLFKDGVYLRETADHEPLGVFWESLGPEFIWGGRFDDGNHYQYGKG
jgi:hypothetical protein